MNIGINDAPRSEDDDLLDAPGIDNLFGSMMAGMKKAELEAKRDRLVGALLQLLKVTDQLTHTTAMITEIVDASLCDVMDELDDLDASSGEDEAA